MPLAAGAAEGVRRVEQQLQPAPSRDARQLVHVARPAPQVHADDARRARRDGGLHARRVEAVRRRIDVGEHRRDLLPLQGVRGGDEGERRNDDLAGEPERPHERAPARWCRWRPGRSGARRSTPAMRRSSSITYSPRLVSQRRSSMSFSRARKRSRSPMLGRPTCNCSANAGAAPNSASAGAGRADFPGVLGVVPKGVVRARASTRPPRAPACVLRFPLPSWRR